MTVTGVFGDPVDMAPAVRTDRPDAPPMLATVMRVLIAVPFVAEAVRIMRAGFRPLVGLVPDDAFYYLEIARHLASGDGATFDGIHRTNGFHPLWQFLLVPFAWIFRGDTAFIRAALLAQLALVALALVLVMRVVRDGFGEIASLVVGCLYTFGSGFLESRLDGMEGAATMVAFALVLIALARFGRTPSNRNAAWVAAACVAVVLGRLDALAVVWIVPVAVALRTRSWRHVASWTGAFAAVGAPFAAAWLLAFRHLVSVSATAKQIDLQRAIDATFGGRTTAGYRSFVATGAREYAHLVRTAATPRSGTWGLVALTVVNVLAIIGVAAILLARRPRAAAAPDATAHMTARLDPARWALLVCGVTIAVKAVIDLVGSPLWAMAWYSAPQFLAAAAAIGILASLGADLVRRVAAPLLVVVALVPIVGLVHQVEVVTGRGGTRSAPTAWQAENDRAATWIRSHGAAGRYGARDAGLLGYRLGGTRPVVNLDGLVNDYDFVELVRRDASLLERVRATRVEYLVGRLTDEDAAQFGCARTLYRSERVLAYTDPLTPYATGPLVVLDTRDCLTASRR